MKLVNYQRTIEAADLASVPDPKGNAGWLKGTHSVVDIQRAYDVVQERMGRPIQAQIRLSIGSLNLLLEHGYAAAGWGWLEALKGEFDLALAAGDERAATAISNLSDPLLLPFQPNSFRDFYAFEQHVKTCRRKRSLDMVPEWYKYPAFYFSNAACFRGPGEPVWAPKGCKELDFELEVACVIGKPGESIRADKAEEHIAGYLVLNDWSARDIQRDEMRVGLGPAKGKDFATSMGPMLVTPSEIAKRRLGSGIELRHQLQMTAKVNGRSVSAGNLLDLHYSFAEMIERASADVMLSARDVIGSGTVGTGCILELGNDIQPWLHPGDVVELEVEELGVLKTPIERRPGGV